MTGGKPEQISAAAITEELVGAESLNLVIESFRRYIDDLRANDQRAVLRTGNHTTGIIKYAGGDMSQFESYETGLSIVPGSGLVLDSLVQIDGLSEEADYVSRLHVGDSHFFMSASGMVRALRKGAGLKNVYYKSTKQIFGNTARKVVPHIS